MTRHRGNVALLWAAAAGVAIQALSSAAVGAAMALVVNEMRTSTLSVPEASTLAARPWLLPVLMFLGIVGIMIGASLYRSSARLYRGGEQPPGLVVPIGLATATVAFTAVSLRWDDIAPIGYTVDTWDGSHDDWGPWAWIVYRMNIWLPLLLLLAVTVLVAWTSWRHTKVRAGERAERDRLLRRGGRRVPGEVVEVRLHHSTDDNGSKTVTGATATVRYLDLHETTRWIIRTVSGRAVALQLRDGVSAAEVLYDPEAPDDESLIFVALQRDPLPSDWIGRSGS